jgi:hypothetical protein
VIFSTPKTKKFGLQDVKGFFEGQLPRCFVQLGTSCFRVFEEPGRLRARAGWWQLKFEVYM